MTNATAPDRLVPGVSTCLAAGLLAAAASWVAPLASPMLVAIVLGMVVGTVRPPGPVTAAGFGFAGRTLLRVGIVLLGFRVDLDQVVGLGPGTLVLIAVVVVSGIAATLAVGRLLGLSWTQHLLIAGGSSICGAAAVAALSGTVDAEEDETATAIATVVLYGTAMIAVVPLLSDLLGLDERTSGIWAGASIHEVAQVVATGGLLGGGALAVAVVVKLGRVLVLAAVTAWVSWHERRRLLGGETAPASLPPVVPGFVAGFLAVVVLHSVVPVPSWTLDVTSGAQTLLLSAAMFALGAGVRPGQLRRGGFRPLLLGGFATVWVGTVGLVGAVLVA